MKLLKIAVNLTAMMFPMLSARISYRIWARTQRYPRKKIEQACWQSANKTVVKIDGEDVAIYIWESLSGKFDKDSPFVLLIHGWNGRATQYFAFIEHLLDHGYRILAFDAPGHGDSSGHQTGLIQMTTIVKALQQRVGHFDAIIGHSFGFIVAVNALKCGVTAKKMIGISAPSDFKLLLQAYTDYFGLNQKAVRALTIFLEKRYALQSLDEISIHHMAEKIRLPCLLLHDEKDKQVPITEAIKIQNVWQDAKLVRVQGSGHLRILYKQAAVDQSIAFLEKHYCAKLPIL